MTNGLPNMISSIVVDVLTGGSSGGAATVGAGAETALRQLLRKRHESARDILLEELRDGTRTLDETGEVDEIVAILERYARAAREGAARLNLRLLAKVIAGQAHIGNLVASDFLYYSDLLASLRREEIVFLAVLHRQRISIEKTDPTGISLLDLWQSVGTELIPSLFADDDSMRATATALTRTGLIMIKDATMDGLSYFTTTPIMDRLTSLLNIDDAIEKETS
ncbi:MAG: hypothetical protein ACFE0S_01640 [Rhodospirillales bacterium]